MSKEVCTNSSPTDPYLVGSHETLQVSAVRMMGAFAFTCPCETSVDYLGLISFPLFFFLPLAMVDMRTIRWDVLLYLTAECRAIVATMYRFTAKEASWLRRWWFGAIWPTARSQDRKRSVVCHDSTLSATWRIKNKIGGVSDDSGVCITQILARYFGARYDGLRAR